MCGPGLIQAQVRLRLRSRLGSGSARLLSECCSTDEICSADICLEVQTFPGSDILFNWVRDIDHFSANDTMPLNVTALDTADIVSTLQVKWFIEPTDVCHTFCVSPHSIRKRRKLHEC